MPRLIEWDTFDLRVSGEKLNDLVRTMRIDPVERMELKFSNGLMRVEGSVRKFVSVPFTVEIGEILPSGTVVRVPLRSVATFGGLPVPKFLFGLMKDRLPRELVSFEEPATFVVSLDRFLPPFLSADIQRIWIIDGGLSVTLGRGGADVPPSFSGGLNGRGRPEAG